jgi:16S rRNA (adenine(1408)-N(1))-methyltransferase
LYLATDANVDGLLEIASRAARKPARGGRSNLLCIAEPMDVLANELPESAGKITVILPWGSLLRAVALPEFAALHQLRRLCAAGAELEIVFSYDGRDAGDNGPLGRTHLDETHVSNLLPVYEAAGFRRPGAELISPTNLGKYETTWSKRLAFGQPRQIWRLRSNAV